MADETPAFRRRVARLSLLAAALGLLAIVLLAAAVWVAARTEPKLDVGWLPTGIGSTIPSLGFFIAAGGIAAAVFVSLAALYAAAAMRVLARDRRIPPPLSPGLRKARGVILMPLGRPALRLVAEPELPASVLPDTEASAPPLRLTVLLPPTTRS